MTRNQCRIQNAKCRMQRFVLYSAFCILHFALILVPPCSAQKPQTPGAPLADTPYDQRTDAFRRLLFELGFQPLVSPRDLQENPKESLLIMLGDPSFLATSFPKGLRSFIEQGGAALIATDMSTEGRVGDGLRQLAGVTVKGDTLVVRHRSIKENAQLYLYNDSEYCPFVEPLEGSNILGAITAFIGGKGKPDLFHRNPYPDQPPLQVATNGPSYLITSSWSLPPGIHRLARLPRICQIEEMDPSLPGTSKNYRFVDANGPLFAVGGTVGEGRVLVLADHSIFINRMILPRDNGNMEFAANCLHWLRGGTASPMEGLRALNDPKAIQQLVGQRDHVLFWDDGTPRTNFHVPLKKMPAPPTLASEPAIVAALDKTIARLEENDSFNRALLEHIDEMSGGRERVLRTAVYLLTLVAFLFLGYRFLWRTRHRPELAVPLLSKTLREHEPKAPLLDQRRHALLRSGNVWEMGHRLAQECFESAGISLTSPSPPHVVMRQGSRWQRWRVHRRIARLWRLARGKSPKPLSLAALQQRQREIEELKTALANGTIVLG